MIESGNEHIIIGNDALMKCEIPSFVSDIVQVHSWLDNEANEYYVKDATYSNSKRKLFYFECPFYGVHTSKCCSVGCEDIVPILFSLFSRLKS